MKTLLALLLLIPSLSISHSGMTNQGGCHMNYFTQEYHCHQKKQTNPLQTYYCINYQFQKYGPYKSYYSCQGAISGSGIMGAYCTPC